MFQPALVCNIPGYSVKPTAVCPNVIPTVQTPSTVPHPGYHPPKNKVNSKKYTITLQHTCQQMSKNADNHGDHSTFWRLYQCNGCQNNPVHTGISNNRCFIIFLIACNVNTHHGGASLDGCCRCLTWLALTLAKHNSLPPAANFSSRDSVELLITTHKFAALTTKPFPSPVPYLRSLAGGWTGEAALRSEEVPGKKETPLRWR